MEENINFDQLKAEFIKLKADFQEKAQKILKDEFKTVFDNTQIKMIRWTQYSPFFNDGAECIFDVYDPVFATASEMDPKEIDWCEVEYGDGDEFDFKAYSIYAMKYEDCILSPDEIAICKKLAELLDDDDMAEILEDMFGNHVEVIATPNGFTVTEYEHD